MAKAKAKKWNEKPVSEWNVRNFHDYMTHITREKYGVTYTPFGQGSINERWRTEQSNVKWMIQNHGAILTKAWVDYCVENYVPKKEYPFIKFGYMFAYLRDDIARVEAQSKRIKEREIIAAIEQKEVDDDWF